jgi:hypothetical protein
MPAFTLPVAASSIAKKPPFEKPTAPTAPFLALGKASSSPMISTKSSKIGLASLVKDLRRSSGLVMPCARRNAGAMQM